MQSNCNSQRCGTNYGVVRLNLLEHIYETLYLQRIQYGNSPAAEEHWRHRILPYRQVRDVQDSPVAKGGVRLQVQDGSPLYLSAVPNAQEGWETMDFDAVFVATGYHRDLHERLLKDARHLMRGADVNDAKWQVGRDYQLLFAEHKVDEDAGVWLQGCCESTHGVCFPLSQWPPLAKAEADRGAQADLQWQLSDSLLSILATRAGEMVRAIFGKSGGWEGRGGQLAEAWSVHD